MIPSEGQVSLEQAALFVRSAPSELGIPDAGEARAVLVQRQDGRWVNHCTVMRLGTASRPASEGVQDKRAGPARLIGREFSARAITNTSMLVDVLTAWQVALPHGFMKMLETSPFGSAVQERPWDFQESANLYHHGSRNHWGTVPCWTVDIYDKQGNNRGIVAPRGPFRDVESGSFAPDLGALVKYWCSDATWRDSTSVQDAYRIIVPDHRGYVQDVTVQGRGVRVIVSGNDLRQPKAALTARDQYRIATTETKDVVAGRVAFILPDDARSFELYLLDDSEVWCDYYFKGDLGTPGDLGSPDVENEHVSEPVGHPVLDQLLAPRYAGPHEYFVKALAYSAGPTVDLPNAAKEAVCAVESLGRIVTGHHSWTLGDIIKHLKKNQKLAPAIAKALEGLWGYASDAPGVRHGGANPPTITVADTQLVIEMSAAAIRYLLELDRVR